MMGEMLFIILKKITTKFARGKKIFKRYNRYIYVKIIFLDSQYIDNKF